MDHSSRPCASWQHSGFAQLLIWLKRYDEHVENAKWLNWLKSCGVMCYSIYLVHLFPGKLISQVLLVTGFHNDASILFICVPLALAVSISLGYLFHVTVEHHFLTSNRESRVQPAQASRLGELPDVEPNLESLRWSYSFQNSNVVANRRSAEEPSSDSQGKKAA